MIQFEWNTDKETANYIKHDVDFTKAQQAFYDPKRITTIDKEQTTEHEIRYFYFGIVDNGVLTVRFTLRNTIIRIIGAGYWRKGRKFYEEKNKIYT